MSIMESIVTFLFVTICVIVEEIQEHPILASLWILVFSTSLVLLVS
jgi:hypothetical protein